jgi:hypothetical protein
VKDSTGKPLSQVVRSLNATETALLEDAIFQDSEQSEKKAGEDKAAK